MSDAPATTTRPPIEDWATDFDHTHPDYAAAATEVWDELRDRCPVAHTERFGGRGCPPDTTTSPRSPTTPSTSRARASSSPTGGRSCPSRWDTPRPSPPTRRSTPMPAVCCLPAVRAQGHREVGTGGPPVVPRAPRRHREPGRRGRRRRRCRGRVHAAHPGAGDRRHAGAAGGGRRSVPHVHPPDHRGARPDRHEHGGAGGHARPLPHPCDRREARAAGRRPHQLPAHGRARGRAR